MKNKKIIIIIPLLVLSVILYSVYYNEYLAWDYDVTSFGNYNNDPEEISKIELGFHMPPACPHYEMYLVTIKDRKNIKRVTDILGKMKFNDGDIMTFGGAGGNLFWVLAEVCGDAMAGFVCHDASNIPLQGYASATVSHAAAHKARYLMPGKTLVYSITLNIWLKCRRC